MWDALLLPHCLRRFSARFCRSGPLSGEEQLFVCCSVAGGSLESRFDARSAGPPWVVSSSSRALPAQFRLSEAPLVVISEAPRVCLCSTDMSMRSWSLPGASLARLGTHQLAHYPRVSSLPPSFLLRQTHKRGKTVLAHPPSDRPVLMSLATLSSTSTSTSKQQP